MTRDITDVVKLDRHAEAIRAAGKRAVSNIFRIGRHLIEAKDLCGHGKWSAWLDNEFGWSADTAERYMQAARMIEIRNLRNLPDLSISSVYLLARPSTPEEVRREVLDRAARGEKLSDADVKAVVKVKPSKRTRAAVRALAAMVPDEDMLIEQIIDLFKRLSRGAQTRCSVKLRNILRGNV